MSDTPVFDQCPFRERYADYEQQVCRQKSDVEIITEALRDHRTTRHADRQKARAKSSAAK
jgi:hypothetical protein